MYSERADTPQRAKEKLGVGSELGEFNLDPTVT